MAGNKSRSTSNTHTVRQRGKTGTKKPARKGWRRKTAKRRTNLLPNLLCRRRRDNIQNRNLLNTLCDDDDDGHNGIENGNIILYGDQGKTHHHHGGGYDDIGGYGGQAYPPYGPVGAGGYGHEGGGQHDFIEYQGPSGYGTGGRYGGSYGGGYGGGYGYQRPLQLLRIIKDDEPEGIFDTFLSFFDIGFEPFVLLLGLAGIGAAAVLFSAITNAGKRSYKYSFLQGRNWLKQITDQQFKYIEEIHENVIKGSKIY